MGGRGYLPEADCVPTLVIETMDLPTPPAQPVSLWLSAYAKIPAQCLPVQHKLAQGLSSTLARAEAAAQGCFDALMLTTQGHISETSSGNIFWLEGDTLHTPSLACDALDGITRRFILEHAPMEVREDVYSTTDIARAEAVIICNTAWNILPVRNLLPGSTKWRSESLAQTLNSLLMKDIADHAAKALAR